MGSMVLASIDAEPVQGFKHDWEEPYLANSTSLIFKNTFEDIEYILTTCAENQTRFEIECYDVGHLYTLAHFADRGIVKPPFFGNLSLAFWAGLARMKNVIHKRTADRLFGADYRWSVLGTGRHQMRIAAMAAGMGGNVRVGLEDSLWGGPKQLAKSNAEQVSRVRALIVGMGLEIASPDEAREILQLKGADRVGF